MSNDEDRKIRDIKAKVNVLNTSLNFAGSTCSFPAQNKLVDLFNEYSRCLRDEKQRERATMKQQRLDEHSRAATETATAQTAVVAEGAEKRREIESYDALIQQSSVYQSKSDGRVYYFYLGKETIHLIKKGKEGDRSGMNEFTPAIPDTYYLVEMYIFIKCESSGTLTPLFFIVKTKEEKDGTITGLPEEKRSTDSVTLDNLINDLIPIGGPKENAEKIMTDLLGYTRRPSEGYFRPSPGWEITNEGDLISTRDKIAFRQPKGAKFNLYSKPNECILKGKITLRLRVYYIESILPQIHEVFDFRNYLAAKQTGLDRPLEIGYNVRGGGGKKTKNSKGNKKELTKKSKKTKKTNKTKKSKKTKKTKK